ncbi:hypothetical protein ABIB25_004024 [Nakamurella sp. UYEF19]|uniref:hypothetical protein n=1 Tax=Nakamurella sp. UYEF19 TaxID=1756392 RepID=UPI003395E4FA
MPESRMRRAAQALRDPWSLLAAAVGAGAAWALALPVVGVGAVGIAMLAVAAVAGAAVSERQATVEAKLLIPGTIQFDLVGTLDGYLDDLIRLAAGALAPVLAGQAADGVEAARSARGVAVGVAGSIDVLDGALSEADQVARRMTSADKVAGPMDRMAARRQGLLDKLSTAVDGVGELYTKLLELSSTPELAPGAVLDHGPDPVAEVNDSLDAIRGAFADLDSAARTAIAGLDTPRPR